MAIADVLVNTVSTFYLEHEPDIDLRWPNDTKTCSPRDLSKGKERWKKCLNTRILKDSLKADRP